MNSRTIIDDYVESLENVFLSGGALGADRLFGLYANSKNIDFIHFSFEGHSSKESNLLNIPYDILESTEVVNALYKANKTLKRKVPYKKSYVYRLLARNYFQIYKTDKIYALCKVLSPTSIDGGTAWAIQMYIDKCKVENKKINVYIYCIKSHRIYTYCNETDQFIVTESVPMPTGRCTGIGSREATTNDLNALIQSFVPV